MPVQTTYPGVYIEERPSGAHAIAGVSTSVTAFVGAAAQGPADTPVRIFSVADYARTFKAQKDMQIDVWLASHASQFKLHDKYKPGDPFNPDRFVDPQGFKAAVAQLEKTYRDQLNKERTPK